MKITWIHGVKRLRGASMSKWVDQLWVELAGAADTADMEITIDSIDGIPLPFLKGIVNRYLLYSLHSLRLDSDLFHIHDHANAHLVPLLPKKALKVVTVHDIYMLEQPPYRLKSYPFRLFNVPGIKRADHIVSVSRHMKEEIAHRLSYPTERMSVTYCGIDHSLYRPRPGGEGHPHPADRHIGSARLTLRPIPATEPAWKPTLGPRAPFRQDPASCATYLLAARCSRWP